MLADLFIETTKPWITNLPWGGDPDDTSLKNIAICDAALLIGTHTYGVWYTLIFYS